MSYWRNVECMKLSCVWATADSYDRTKSAVLHYGIIPLLHVSGLWGECWSKGEIFLSSLPCFSSWQKLAFLICQHHCSTTAVHTSISRGLFGNDTSAKILSMERRSAVPKGAVVGCCCWRSFAWEIILLCYYLTPELSQMFVCWVGRVHFVASVY